MSTPTQPSLHYFNRYTNQIEAELIYGEDWIEWLYYHPFGSLMLFTVVKRAFLSKYYGRCMDDPSSLRYLHTFLNQYPVDTAASAVPVPSFKTFNEFFYRKLRADARPICKEPGTLCFPADGRHLGFENISMTRDIFVKGQIFRLSKLVEDEIIEERFLDGPVVLSRLSPVDYHRFHFPVSGIATQSRLIKGPLFSVNPLALRRKIEILWTNKRMVTQIQTEDMGMVLMIEIGATMVGTIVQTYKPNEPVQKGDEKGYFKFGGSSTLLVFEKDRVKLSDDLITQTQKGYELYAHMGDIMGTVC